MRAARVVRGVLVSALAAAPLAVLPTTAAAAEEIYGRPSDGVFTIEGHGWGHGHGLSQWGAEGAASKGVSATTILNTYYPSTGTATQSARTIRVLIGEDDHSDICVRATSGLQVRDLASGAAYTLPGGPARWRIYADSAGEHVQSYTSGTWTTWSTGGKSSWTGPMQFQGATPLRLMLRIVTVGRVRSSGTIWASEPWIHSVGRSPNEGPSATRVIAANSCSSVTRRKGPW